MKKHLQNILQKNKTAILYAVFGVGTTVFNVLLYQLLLIGCDYRVSNLIAIVATKILAYIVNKGFVFQSRCKSILELLQEMFMYILTRGLTGVLDYFGVIFMVNLLQCSEVISKYVMTVIVVIANYIFGKYIVFQKRCNIQRKG